MREIPMAEFDTFEYHRAGNLSSLHIQAENAHMDKDIIIIEKVSLQADYGPFVNFNIKLEGYKRARINEDKLENIPSE